VTRALVVAKAPVAGQAKTRLGAVVGDEAAADLAAAALLDTLAACEGAFDGRCHLAISGDLDGAARQAEIRTALSSWRVFEQVGAGLDERLAHAHLTLAAESPGAVVQVGLDTPQLTPTLLRAAAARVCPRNAVLGPAVDGGWWLLGLDEPAAAAVLVGVPMSSAETGRETHSALMVAGLEVALAPTLRDVDTVADADRVAREAPWTRFAAAWSRLAAVV
jgi:rSAM/selenodomain-associated transferase 1